MISPTEFPNISQKATRLGNWLTGADEGAAGRPPTAQQCNYVILFLLVGCALGEDEYTFASGTRR
jgi:hypothetical protein